MSLFSDFTHEFDRFYDFCGSDEGGLLIWGLLSRGIGLMFAISLFAYSRQAVSFGGKYGLTPFKDTMRNWKRDFGIRAYLYYPTLFWINSSDFFLWFLPFLGGISGLLCFLGSSYAPYLSLFCWMCMVSIDSGPHHMVYPWDSLLFEMGFLSIFLPATKAPVFILKAVKYVLALSTPLVTNSIVPQGDNVMSDCGKDDPFNVSLSAMHQPASCTDNASVALGSRFATALDASLAAAEKSSLVSSLSISFLPSALHAWAFRYLLFRVLFGFGKLKFLGSGWRDRLYIKGFFICQPMVSPLGLWMYQNLPDIFYPALLFGMWLVEIPLPCAVFTCSGMIRFIAAVGIIKLMLGIQVGGNFGYFNITTIVLALASLHHSATISWSLQDLAPVDALPHLLRGEISSFFKFHVPSTILSAIYLFYIFPASLVQLIMNSWVNLSWVYWSGIYRIRFPLVARWSQWYANLIRILMPLRIVQAYGVFPPQTSPPQRWAMCVEGSEDGENWKRYEYRYYISAPTTKPRFIAPFHPRFDHAVFYESLAIAGLSATLGHNTPYSAFSSTTVYTKLMTKLLLGGKAAQGVSYFFRKNPFPNFDTPPKYVRMVACHYLPASVQHTKKTGEYWHETVVCVHHQPMSLDLLLEAQPDMNSSATPSTAIVERNVAVMRETLRNRGACEAAIASVARRAPEAPQGDSEGAVAWPWCDETPPGAENFWWESVFWKRRARYAHKPVTESEYEKAWEFLADVRKAAAAVAKQRVEEARTQPGSNGCGRISTHAVVPGQTKIQAQEQVLRPETADKAVVKKMLLSHIRLPLDTATLDEAVQHMDTLASEGNASGLAEDNLPLESANSLFIWSLLPETLIELRKKYTQADIVNHRGTINRMITPMLRMLECVYGRATPTEAEVDAELRANSQDPNSALARAYKDHCLHADGNPTRDVTLGPLKDDGTPLYPTTTEEGYPIRYFQGNDDAMLNGCMRNPMRWGMYAHWTLLVGGRIIYETILAEFDERIFPLLSGRIPLGFSGDGAKDAIAKETPFSIFKKMNSHHAAADLQPSKMASEAGTFLLFLFAHDAVVQQAMSYHRLSSQSRPGKERPISSSPQPFLPGFLEFVPRLNAHIEMRKWIITSEKMKQLYLLPPSTTGYKDIGFLPRKEYNSLDDGNSFTVEPIVPLWCQNEDESWWIFNGYFYNS